MFFILSKTLGFFAVPSNVILLVPRPGVLLLATRFARGGRRLTVASVVLLVAGRAVAARQRADPAARAALPA